MAFRNTPTASEGFPSALPGKGTMVKNVLLFVAAAAGVASGAWTLVRSWPTPGANPRGIEGYGYGYLVQDGPSPQVFCVNGYTGSVYSSFAAPGGAGAWGVCRGNAFSDLYLSNYLTSYVYHTTSAGSVMDSFHAALAGPADMDYSYGLYVAFPDQNLIARLDVTTGSVLASYAGPGTRATASYYGHWIVADSVTHTIYSDGVPIITTIQTPLGLSGDMTMSRMVCLAVVDDATDRVYQYFDSNAVAPASLGRIRALYR